MNRGARTQSILRSRAVLAGALFMVACSTQKAVVTPQTNPEKETPEVPDKWADKKPDAGEAADAGADAKAAPRRQFQDDPGLRSAFEHAMSLVTAGDPAGARRELKSLVSREPQLDYAWTNLGVFAERAGQASEAEEDYERALASNPDQGAAWDFLTRMKCRAGKAKEVESRLRARIQESPEALGPRTALVQALVCQGVLDQAIAEAKKVLKADERNTRAMLLIAQAYLKEGKLELAKLVLENARAIDGADAAIHQGLGLVHLAMKSRPQALESFKQAVTLEPEFAEARNNYGALLNEAQDYDSAAHELEAAVASAPDFAAAHLNLGNAYRGQGQVEKAQTEYDAALKLDPSYTDVYFNLAVLHLDGETSKEEPIARFQKAIAYFQQYQGKGGADDRVGQYLKDAKKGIEREERKKEREKKDALRKAAKPEAPKPEGSDAPPPPPPKGEEKKPAVAEPAPPESSPTDAPAPKASAKLPKNKKKRNK